MNSQLNYLDPTCWSGSDLESGRRWATRLPFDSGTHAEAFAHAGQFVREMLDRGPGLALISGFTAVPEATARRNGFLQIAAMVGRVREGPGGRSYGTISPSPSGVPRLDYRSAARAASRVRLHTEHGRKVNPPRALGLLCEQPAVSGGETLVASAAHVYGQLVIESPGAVRVLSRPVPLARHPESVEPDGLDWAPVFSLPPDRVAMRYPRYWLQEGLRRAPVDRVGSAVEALDEVLERPGVAARIRLAHGDALFIDNRRLLHGRAAFDVDTCDVPRLLVRVLVD